MKMLLIPAHINETFLFQINQSYNKYFPAARPKSQQLLNERKCILLATEGEGVESGYFKCL